MKIAILGYGREGKAVVDFLKKSPKYDFAEIYILDQNPKLEVPRGLRRRLGKHYLKKLTDFGLVFRSPGVPFTSPEIQDAIKKGVHISSATKVFFENFSGRIIGVTGTKGKGTTSTLIYEMLTRGGFDVHLAGNIGRPALEILPLLKQHSIVVLELSSFQLHDLTISPAIAVVLDIFPDHMDAHTNFKEYYAAKATIGAYQTTDNKIFYFTHNTYAARIARASRAQKTAVAPEKFTLFRPDELRIPGAHNFANAAMAATVALAVGCDTQDVVATAREFPGMEHRLEFVRAWTSPDKKTISFYNDSASTNPQTAAAAVAAFPKPVVLIAGGYDKGLDYAPLAAMMKKTSARSAVLFGANKEKIRAALKQKRFPTLLADTLKDALAAAITAAPDDSIVVFSPGAASFDMFHDYADRGRKFKKIVFSLK